MKTVNPCYSGHRGGKENIYDYTTKQLVFHKLTTNDTIKHLVVNGKDTTLTRLDRSPIFLLGDEIRERTVVNAINYPASHRKIEGSVVVAFNIDANGQIKDYHIANSLDPELDAEALRCIKLIKGDWLPGILNGQPVSVVLTQQLNFRQGVLVLDIFKPITFK